MIRFSASDGEMKSLKKVREGYLYHTCLFYGLEEIDRYPLSLACLQGDPSSCWRLSRLVC